MSKRRIIICWLLAGVAIAVMTSGAPAFCPMCKTAVEAATGAREVAGSLNLAAVVLLAPPVLIFVALFGWFYRLRNASGQQSSPDDTDEKRRALTP